MSLIDIEQNDVDISQLFSYKSEITLLVPGTTDEVKFYQRLIGDADNNKARVYALRESAKFREQLKDPKWEDRLAFLPNVRKLTKEELVEVILALEVQDFSLDAINETELALPPDIKGDANLEEQEEHQKKVDEYKDNMNTEIAKNLKNRIDNRRAQLSKTLKAKLQEQYEESLIVRLCQEKFGQCYLEKAAYFGTFTDSKYTVKAFRSFEDFDNAPSNLKEALVSNYGKLQIGGVTLKKSQGVTQ